MVIESRERCKNSTVRRKISQEKWAWKFTTKGVGTTFLPWGDIAGEYGLVPTEKSQTATWQHARILNVWGRGRGTFSLASKHEMALKITEKLQKSLWKALKDNLEVYDEIVLSLKITCIIEKVQDYPD